jgi:hypothetical protein
MTINTQALTVFRGDKKTWEGVVTDLDGVAVDITNALIYFTVRSVFPAGTIPDDTDSDVLLKKTVGSGITLSDPSNGVFEFTVAKADTNALEILSNVREYLYQIGIVGSGETEPNTLAAGKFLVSADVVRGV